MLTSDVLKKLSHNVNVLMAEYRLSSSELARQTGVPATSIKRLRNNEQANPTVSTLLPIAQFFGLSLSELVCESNVIHQHKGSSVQAVPLLTWQTCIEVNNADPLEFITTCSKRSDSAFALRVDSEESSSFPKGCIIIVEPQLTAKDGDFIVVAKTSGGSVSIKKMLVDLDQCYLRSLRPGLEVMHLHADIRIFGVVTEYYFHF
jgi:SOS-response transcriptional repressor LexA